MRIAEFFLALERRLAGEGPEPPASRRYLIVGMWLAGVAGVVAMVVVTGFPVMWEKLNDALVFLDSAWRVWNGQVPHRDFYSVIGPYPHAVFALGFVFNHQDVTGFPLALLAAGLAFSTLSWRASHDRLTPWWRLIVAFFFLLLPVAATFLGGGEDLGGGKGPPFGFVGHTNYAMQYNRLGWSALCLQMLVMLIPRMSEETRAQAFQDAVLGGAMLGLGIFCKINFLLGAVGLAVFWWLFCPSWRCLRLAGLLAGVLAVAGVLAAFPGGVVEYFADQWRLLHVSREESHFASVFVRLRANAGWLVLLAALQLSTWSACYAPLRARGAHQAWMWLANFWVAMGVSMFVLTFNTQRGQVPGFLIAALIAVEMIRRLQPAVHRERPAAWTDGWVTRTVILKITCAAFAASAICYDAGSLLYATWWKLRKPQWAKDSERLPGMLQPIPIPVFFNEPRDQLAVNAALNRRRSGPWINTGTDNHMTSRQTTRWINDGVELLAGKVKPDDRIFVAAWFNPFNLAFRLPPARGGGMHWDYDRVVDGKIHPDVGRTLAEVTLFLVPKRADWKEQRDFMTGIYGRGFGSDFHLAGESEFWQCWRR